MPRLTSESTFGADGRAYAISAGVSRWTWILTVGLLLSATALVLCLASARFQSGLNSDELLPQMFLRDLWDAEHPITGWRYGSATFWFPDYPVFGTLMAVCGVGGLAFPLYAAAVYVGIGLAMGWALTEAGLRGGRGWVWGGVVLNGVLACQFVGDHGNWLWRAGWAAFHGGTVFTGFLVLALVLRALRTGAWSRAMQGVLIALMAVGLISNALLLFHWIVPIGLVLGWRAWRGAGSKTDARVFARCVGGGMAVMVVVRAGLWWMEWFYYAPLFRQWPLPGLIFTTVLKFWADFTTGGVFARQWIFWVLAPAAVAWWFLRKSSCGKREDRAVRLALPALVIGLVFAWTLPMVAVYWRADTSDRYLMNWIFTPAWMLALMIGSRWSAGKRAGIAAGVLALAGLMVAAPKIELARLEFPRAQGGEALLQFCQERGLKQGLSDFWTGYWLTAMWRHEGPGLGHIRDKDFTYFWCNNVFGYFPRRELGEGRKTLAIQFIVLKGLNSKLLAERIGGELRIEKVGGYHVAILSAEQQARVGELVRADAEKFMGSDGRARWLQEQLNLPR